MRETSWEAELTSGKRKAGWGREGIGKIPRIRVVEAMFGRDGITNEGLAKIWDVSPYRMSSSAAAAVKWANRFGVVIIKVHVGSIGNRKKMTNRSYFRGPRVRKRRWAEVEYFLTHRGRWPEDVRRKKGEE